MANGKDKKGFKRPASLPRLPDAALVPYAKCRDELKGFSEGQITRMILDTDAWNEVMVPILETLDEETRGERGPRRLFTAHELEAVLLFQRVCGLRSYKEARDRLAGDQDEARRLLNLAQAKQRHRGAVIQLRDGIPSRSTVSRHRTRFGEDQRLYAYTQLFDRLLDEHLQDPAMQEECRILDIDGSHVLTHYTCPTTKNGRVTNADSVTCPDGGYLPPTEKRPGHGGHGFNLVSITTATGLPIAHRISPIHASERAAAIDLLSSDYAEKVKPHLDPTKLGTLSGDGGFNSPALRKLARDLGLVENIHISSHANTLSAKRSTNRRNRKRIRIEGYPNWFANGHREISCRCGEGTTARVFERNARTGKAVARVEGRCGTCGNITITSGLWKKADNPDAFRRVQPGETEIDWGFGNPLTYNDPLSREFGSGRFGHQEGFHGSLVTRFRFLKTKHWYRRGDTARVDALMTFCVMHSVAMEQRRRARANAQATLAATGTAPPGSP